MQDETRGKTKTRPLAIPIPSRCPTSFLFICEYDVMLAFVQKPHLSVFADPYYQCVLIGQQSCLIKRSVGSIQTLVVVFERFVLRSWTLPCQLRQTHSENAYCCKRLLQSSVIERSSPGGAGLHLSTPGKRRRFGVEERWLDPYIRLMDSTIRGCARLRC